MNIILMGYRGSGKTTLGRMLADETWKTFIDTDDEIIRKYGGMTIADIWAAHGEPAFRQTELQVIRDFCGQADIVLALGGGAVMQPEARKAVKDAPDARRVYLFCRPEELHRRIIADPRSPANRPNLTDIGGLDEIKMVLAQRDEIYREVADKVFDVTFLTPIDAMRHLIRLCL